jgi:WD domain, G-beta repeat
MHYTVHSVIWLLCVTLAFGLLRQHAKLAYLIYNLRRASRGLYIFMQIWDLDTQHCVQTVVGHRSEVWSLDVSPDGTRLVTTASDAQLRMWSIEQASSSSSTTAASTELVNDLIDSLQCKLAVQC